jgi:(1->4)-alpha-D-glucan 1-alpha-D-glucosylmutase
MAKAFEDTFLYVYNPLTSLNEVGGDPRPSVATRESFPRFLAERSEHWPNSMNATTTHDTKRSEDVRARINVLSEIPEQWRERLELWSKLNSKYKTQADGQQVPDRNEEVLLYQTLLGVWPADGKGDTSLVERLQAYAVKATREAMVHTRWTLPNVAHEDALKKFVASVLKPASSNAFLRDFVAFQQNIAYSGMVNGLTQTLVKIISPGVPDFYQGSELWDLRLVDPDNRQSVDFAKRVSMLAAIRQQSEANTSLAGELARHWENGRIKLYAIWRALNFRRQRPELFANGDFVELKSTGRSAEHVLAMLRHYKREWVLLVAPRWLARAQEGRNSDANIRWQEVAIQVSDSAPLLWENIFTGEKITIADQRAKSLHIEQLLNRFPIALLSGRTQSANR